MRGPGETAKTFVIMNVEGVCLLVDDWAWDWAWLLLVVLSEWNTQLEKKIAYGFVEAGKV